MRFRFSDNIRFCPKCGVETLERDYLRQSPPKPGAPPEEQGEKGRKAVGDGSEWLCRVCGFGFRITKSARHCMVLDLISAERKLRSTVKFTAECVGAEVAQLYVEARERGEF